MDTLPEPELSPVAHRILRARYLRRNKHDVVCETPAEMFWRVASHVAAAEARYAEADRQEAIAREFYEMMAAGRFLPNSPTLMNAGTRTGVLSGCFVVPVHDSLASIMTAAKQMALIHQAGGGTGFSFSELRPADTPIRGTGGRTSGPVSFIEMFNHIGCIIRQGGRRRGANMAVLRADHPDIFAFIQAKRDVAALTSFNLSVAVSDEFMQAVRDGGLVRLHHPRAPGHARTVRAEEIFEAVVEAAWQTGEPGLLFLDRINRDNPTPALGRLEAVNPCAEQPLLPYESCNLGSINLAKFLAGGRLDREQLRRTVHLAVRFLDNVIDVNRFPFRSIERVTRANRKIGLGVMGFADLLVMLQVGYDEPRAGEIAEEVISFVREEAVAASCRLAEVRGPFPNFERSIFAGGPARRHATVTTIAPTGTISLIAGCSAGIEPYYRLIYRRRALESEQFEIANPLLEEHLRRAGCADKPTLRRIHQTGSVRDVPGVPDPIRRIFPTANEVPPDQHVRIQAAFQKYTDNGVSKTVNLPADATRQDVRRIFLLAHELGCKGITVYRDQSRPGQVLRPLRYKGA